MPCVGLTEAGSIVVLLALGVAISNADWRERVGEGGGEWSWRSAAVSISSSARYYIKRYDLYINMLNLQ